MNSKSDGNASFFKQTFFVFIIKIFGAAFAFLNQVVLSRNLGLEDYGALSIFLSLANVLILFPLLGMDTGIIRSVASFEKRVTRKSLLASNIKIITILLLCLALLIFTSGDFVFEKFKLNNELVVYLIVYVGLLVYSKILDGFLQGEKKTLLQNFLTQFVNNLLKFATFFVVFKFFNDLRIAIQIMCAVEAVLLIIKSVYINRQYKDVKAKPYPKQQVKEYLAYCIPLFLVSSIDMIQISLNKFFTSFLMGNTEVGVIRVFENYSAVLAMFVTPFVTMWPLMSEYYSKGKLEELKNLFKQTTMIIAILIIPAWVTLTICNSEILGIFGISSSQIEYAQLIMFIFFLGTVYDAIVGPAGALLQMTEYSRISLYNTLILLVVNIILCLVLIPKFGLLGVAIATSASLIFINTLNVIQNKRLFNLFPYGINHVILIAIGIPIYFVGKAFKSFIDTNDIVNIILVGIFVYIIYFVIALILYRDLVNQALKKFKRSR